MPPDPPSSSMLSVLHTTKIPRYMQLWFQNLEVTFLAWPLQICFLRPCLQVRRKQARLIFLFKILNGLICIPNQYLPSPFPVTTTTSRNPIKSQQLYTRTDIYHYSFLPRTIPDWNNLRIDNINELDLTQFKDLVIKLWTDFYIYIRMLPLVGFC